MRKKATDTLLLHHRSDQTNKIALFASEDKNRKKNTHAFVIKLKTTYSDLATLFQIHYFSDGKVTTKLIQFTHCNIQFYWETIENYKLFPLKFRATEHFFFFFVIFIYGRN